MDSNLQQVFYPPITSQPAWGNGFQHQHVQNIQLPKVYQEVPTSLDFLARLDEMQVHQRVFMLGFHLKSPDIPVIIDSSLD